MPDTAVGAMGMTLYNNEARPNSVAGRGRPRMLGWENVSSESKEEEMMRVCRICMLVSMVAASPLYADAMVGPFVSGSGSWTTLDNGNFESGDLSGWSDGSLSSGGFSVSGSNAIAGGFAATTNTLHEMDRDGYCIYQTVPVSPGQYVLSGFFSTAGLTGGKLFLDLNDASFEAEASAPVGVSEIQFVSSVITVPADVSSVVVRLIRDGWGDGICSPGEIGIVDEIALTPIAQFAAPTIVPEPTALALLALGGLVLTGRKPR